MGRYLVLGLTNIWVRDKYYFRSHFGHLFIVQSARNASLLDIVIFGNKYVLEAYSL